MDIAAVIASIMALVSSMFGGVPANIPDLPQLSSVIGDFDDWDDDWDDWDDDWDDDDWDD